MIAKNKKQAWAMVDKLFPGDYEWNATYTYNAGYDVYTSIAYGSACRIADLGDRLEVTIGDETFNIWIENINKDGYYVDYNNGFVIGPVETDTRKKILSSTILINAVKYPRHGSEYGGEHLCNHGTMTAILLLQAADGMAIGNGYFNN